MATWALYKQLFVSKFGRRVFAALLVVALFLGGVQLRRWIGESTRHVRYQHDIVNAFYWGSETLKEARRLSPNESAANSFTGFCRGYFALYDRVKGKSYENDYGLDYPPLRLLVMAIWAKEVRNQFPGVDDGHPKLVNPLLKINLLCELLSAVAIFFLVRLCVQRCSRTTRSSLLPGLPLRDRASICGLAAASVAWLEPSMILDAHGWPQWDVWILPFYLFAALAALKNRWFVCGCLFGSEHYPYLVISSCYNLPSLLSQLGWSLKDPFCSVHFGSLHFDLTLQWTLRLLYLGALTVCAYGAAQQVRNRDPRVLIAITAPWLLMFTLLGQMHERYFVWGAVVSAVALGVSFRLSIIHFIISAARTAMIEHVMRIDKKREGTLWAIDLLKHIRPYASVLVLACVAVYVRNTLRLPVFERRAPRPAASPSLSLGPEPEEA